MKRVLFALALLSLAGAVSAQTPPAETTSTAPQTTSTAETTSTAPATTPTAPAATTPTTTASACNPEQAGSDCTVRQAFDYYRAQAGLLPVVKAKVTNANRATTPPDTFAGRIHNSYQDFLNLLSFAVSEVEEADDGSALVVRFNPVREGRNLFGATLTIAEPVLSPLIAPNIPESVRDTTVTSLDGEQGEFSNLIWSGSYSAATPDCAKTPANRRCWGRAPSTYIGVLSALIPDAASNPRFITLSRDLRALYSGEGSIFDRPVSAARDPGTVRDLAKQAAAMDVAQNQQLQQLFTSNHLDLLGTLIDNQPQLTGTISYHTPGDLGGPDQTTATLEFHVGRQNVNTLRKACPDTNGRGACMQRQLTAFAAKGLSTDKFVFTASYTRTDDYTLTTLPVTPAVTGFTAIDQPSSSALSIKAQGGRELAQQVSGKNMRADLSFEGIRNENNDKLTENRWVGTVTLSIPLGNNMTIPVSVTYANKAEFLGDPNEQFGTHIGLSYRLPDLFGGTSSP